jgi:inner membrane protein
MDSLTQIVLGAACGEAIAGKKLGNRAMLWGALGGTIPDLDVFATFFTDEIASTSFHRGFMHSFLFAALAPWLLAWLVQRFYQQKVHQSKGYKRFFVISWALLYLVAAAGINFIPVILGEGLSWYIFLPTLALGIWLFRKLWADYWSRDLSDVEVPYLTWVSLFFWSIFTHPILDCFTNWGTQIWQPFSDMRVQWNTVSVVDPIYTVPFALCLIAAGQFVRSSHWRTVVTWLGIVWSCGYLAFTYWHKTIVEESLLGEMARRNIKVVQHQTNPSIFNNIVWTGIAEGDTAYYWGLYGFKDRQPGFSTISTIPKRHQLLDHIPNDDRAKRFLLWFTNGFYNVKPYKGDTLQVNDLRFGLMGDSLTGNNYVFPFLLFKNEKGQWDIKQNNQNQENVEESKQSMGTLFDRVLHGKQ